MAHPFLLGAFDFASGLENQATDDLLNSESHATSPSLEAMTILAIQCLQFHIGGYFMVAVHPDLAEIEHAGELPTELKRAHAMELNAALRSACEYTGETGTVMLYAPQPDTGGWLLQLKGNHTPDGILDLKQLHQHIHDLF